MTERDGGPAFGSGNPTHGGFTGMSLRDYFAGQALIGVIGAATEMAKMGTFQPKESIASDAYDIADAMLAAREETP